MSELALRWLWLTIDASFKVILLAAGAAVVLRLLRVTNSNVKHAVWLGVLAGMLLFPVLAPVLPAISVPLPLRATSVLPFETPVESTGVDRQASPVGRSTETDPVRPAALRERSSSAWEMEGFIDTAGRVNADRPDTTTAGDLDRRPAAIKPAVAAASQQSATGKRAAAGAAVARQAARPSMVDLRASAPVWLVTLMAVWLGGVFLFASRLAIGLFGARRLVGRSTLLATASEVKTWFRSPDRALDQLADDSRACPVPVPGPVDGTGLATAPRDTMPRSFNIRETTELCVPVSTGLFGRTILLPPEWRTWSTEKLRDVLVHEATHLIRKDSLVALLSDLNRCVYWFHPVAWSVRARLAALAEEACDDAAIRSTRNRAAYASHLLEFAGVAASRRGRVVCAGQAIARRSSIESRINAILDFSRPLSDRLSWKGTLLITALIGPVVSAAAALRPAADSNREVSKPAVAVDKPRETTPPQKRQTAAVKETPYSYTGFVVDEHGIPVAGAKISLDYWRSQPPAKVAPPLAVSDDKGRFQFALRKKDFADGGHGVTPAWTSATLIATKDGYGFGARSSVDFETTGMLEAELSSRQRHWKEEAWGKRTNRLTLVRDEVPIRGRVVNTEGRPVAGAKVEAVNIWEGRAQTLDAWEKASRERGGDYYTARNHLRQLVNGNSVRGPRASVVPTTQTDSDGRFLLKGIGRERIAEIFVSGPRIETLMFHARSRSGKLIRLPQGRPANNAGDELFYPADFTIVAGPSIPVEGRITDSKSGKPLAGILVQADKLATNPIHGSIKACSIHAITGLDGSYRLDGFPLGENSLLVIPPSGVPYLPGAAEFNIAPGANSLVQNISLARGVVVRGRAVDERTGMPVPGRLEYFALSTNPHVKDALSFRDAFLNERHRTDEEGRFAIAVLPGKGILAFSADDHEQYPRGVGADRIDGPREVQGTAFNTYPVLCVPVNYHLLTPLDPAPDTKIVGLSLTLRSGVSIPGRVVAPDGKPLSDFYIYGEQSYTNWMWNKGEVFALKGYSPTEHRRLMFYHPGRNLVGLTELTGSPPAKLEVRLTPAAAITGRVVDRDGLPVENASFFNAFAPRRAGKQPETENPERGILLTRLQNRHILTDKQGRFELPGIIPGLKYSALVQVPRKAGQNNSIDGTIFTNVTAQPGEIKELGDLRIRQGQLETETESAKSKKASVRSDGMPHGAVFPIHGRVVDSKGAPIREAAIVISRVRRPRWHASTPESQPIVELKTDEQGRFQAEIPLERLPAPYLKSAGQGPETLQVVASASGYAVEVKAIPRFDKSEPIDFRLAADAPIRGRLLDLEGRPIAHAKVRVLEYSDPDKTKLENWIAAASKSPITRFDEQKMAFEMEGLEAADARFPLHCYSATSPDLLPSSTTDAAGRFELPGIGPDRLAILEVSGPGIVQSLVNVVTRPMSPVKAFGQGSNLSSGVRMFYGSDFDLAASPSVPVEGVVRDLETKQPLADVVVATESISGTIWTREGFIATTTDGHGKYRLEGLPPTKGNSLLVLPIGKPYLVTPGISVPQSARLEPIRRDIDLGRAVLVSGRLLEKDSEKPVQGSVYYTPYSANEFAKNYPRYSGHVHYALGADEYFRTDAAGRFRIPVIPGRGVLVARCDDDAFVHGFGAEQIKQFQGEGSAFDYRVTRDVFQPLFFHALREIDVRPDAKEFSADLTVDRGLAIRVTFLETNGSPLRGKVRIMTIGPGSRWQEAESGSTTLSGLASGQTITLMFGDAKSTKGKLVELTPKPEMKLQTVVLEPMANVRGRLLDATRQPAGGRRVNLTVERSRGEPIWIGTQVKTDAEGRFQLDLVPGGRYRLTGWERSAVIAEHLAPSAGQLIDLGDRVVASKRAP